MKIRISEREWEAAERLMKKSEEVGDKIPKSMEIDLSEEAKRFILRSGIHCVRMGAERGLFESYAYGEKKEGLDKALDRLPVAPKAVQLFKRFLTEELGEVNDLKAAFLYFSTWHNEWMEKHGAEWPHYFVPAHVKEVGEDHVVVEDLKNPERLINKNLPVKVCRWVAVHGNEICGLISEEDAKRMNSILKEIMYKPGKIKVKVSVS